MGRPVSGAAPSVLPTMFQRRTAVVGDALMADVRPAVACRVTGTGIWEARADAPWKDTAYALSSLNRAAVAPQAIVGAILGAVAAGRCAGALRPSQESRMMALAGVLDGHDPEDVAEVFGDEATEAACRTVHAMGFSFGKIFHAFEPMLSKVVSFIPGVGPIASTALDITAAVTSPGAKVPPIPGVPPDVQQSLADAAVALHPASAARPSPSPSHQEALPPHVAAVESSPGGSWVMRF